MIKSVFLNTTIAIASLFLFGFSPISKKETVAFEHQKIIVKTKAKEHAYDAEIALSDKQMERGLMYRTSLEKGKGMLFVFPDDARINMWMKNTLIPLDILFIDKHGKIVYIAENAKPESLDVVTAGDVPVSAVLEVRGGTSEMRNINVGDEVIYKVVKK